MSGKPKEQELKKLLQTIIDNLDAGNTHLDNDQCEDIMDYIHTVISPDISKYNAMRELGVQRTKFDELVQDGKAPRGEHRQGFKELFYNRWKVLKARDKLRGECK